jgi:hypothetical protein
MVRRGGGHVTRVAVWVAGVVLASATVLLTPAAPAAASGPAVVSVGSVTVPEGDQTSSGSVQALVPIVLSQPQTTDVTVTWTVTPGTATPTSDYVPPPPYKTYRTWVIPAGATSIWVPVMIVGDTTPEPDETVYVTVTAVTGGVGIGTATGTLTIDDDDPAGYPVGVGVADATFIETDANQTRVQLSLTLSTPQTVPTVVSWAVTGGTATAGVDYTGTTGTVVIPAGRTRGLITGLWVNGDTIPEPDETITLTITSLTTGVTVTKPVATITLTNNDTATLWTWGNNTFGQLGLGDNFDRDTPTQVGTNTWNTVEAGEDHTVAIRNDGTLWAWGGNWAGQLGLGDTLNRNTPTQVGTATWTAVAAGGNHTVAIRNDDTLWAWGSNWAGQLGLGDNLDRISPTQVGTATNWAAVAAGGNHTAAIRT